MATVRHDQLGSADLHTGMVDVQGTVKIDTKTAGSDAVIRFLETDNKKMVWNFNSSQIDFYINNAAVGVSIGHGILTMKEASTPTAVDSYGKIYCKNNNKIYFQDGAGVEHELAYA